MPWATHTTVRFLCKGMLSLAASHGHPHIAAVDTDNLKISDGLIQLL